MSTRLDEKRLFLLPELTRWSRSNYTPIRSISQLEEMPSKTTFAWLRYQSALDCNVAGIMELSTILAVLAFYH